MTPSPSGVPPNFRSLSRLVCYSGILADADRFLALRSLSRPNSLGLCGMDWPDYLREQAAMYRKLAEEADDPVVKTELLELASVCDEVANNIEDHLTGG